MQEIVKTANEALTLAEILKDKDINLTEINHHINVAATVITKDGNGTGSYGRTNQKRAVQKQRRGLDAYRRV